MNWKDFGGEFERLAREEEGVVPDQRLCASCTYTKPRAILDEKGKPRRQTSCVIRAPKNGLWMLSSGITGFPERFRALAVRPGRALGTRKGTDPEGVWLHHLYSYVREDQNEFLAPKIGGRTSKLREMDTILHVCDASALFCSRLEREAIEQAESGTAHQAPETKSKAEEKAQLTDREKNMWAVIQRVAGGRQYCRELDNAGIAPPRSGVWKDGPRKYLAAYNLEQPWRHRIEDEKSKIRRKAKAAKLAGALASE